MTKEEVNKSVSEIIRLAVENNSSGISNLLMQYGYTTSNSANQLRNTLYQLYIRDRNKFFELMKQFQWNTSTSNWTDVKSNLDKIIPSSSSQASSKIDFGSWWHTGLEFFQSSAGIPGSITTYTENTLAIVALALVAIGIIVGIYFLIKNFKKI